MPPAYYTNMHVHCFTLDHVPEEFFDSLVGGKRFLRISKLRKKGNITNALVYVFTRSWFIWVVRRFSRNGANQLRRLKGLIKYSSEQTQEALLHKLVQFYKQWMPQSSFRFVPLMMDMEYMGAGLPYALYDKQADELLQLKQSAHWKNIIFPFIAADARRPGVANYVKQYLEHGTAAFSGIKLYPALGYYPFDKGLKEVYTYAVQKNIPLVTHCVNGSVYYRPTPAKNTVHPVTGQPCVGKDADEYQLNWTHPLNYECLLNPVLLKKIWGDDAPDLSRLKICLAHFGGENEWVEDKTLMETLQFWKKEKAVRAKPEVDYLDINQPWFGDKRHKWFLIITALLRRYPNVYVDISFTLHDKAIYARLKELLREETIRTRILFGTDFYVVSSVADEDHVLATFKKELNDDALFELIAYENPRRFLNWE